MAIGYDNAGRDGASAATDRVGIQRRLMLASDLIDRGFVDQAKTELLALAEKNPQLLGDASKIGQMTNPELAQAVSTALTRLRAGTSKGSPDSGTTNGSNELRSLGVRRSEIARGRDPLPDAETLALGENPTVRAAALKACNLIRLIKGGEIRDTIDLRLLAGEKWAIEFAGMGRATARSKTHQAPLVKAIALTEHEGELYSLALVVSKKPSPQRVSAIEHEFEATSSTNCSINLYVTSLGDGTVLQFRQPDAFFNSPGDTGVARAIAAKLYAKRGEDLPSSGQLREQPGDQQFLEALKGAKVSELLKGIAANEIKALLDNGSRSQPTPTWDYVSSSVAAHSNPFRGASRR